MVLKFKAFIYLLFFFKKIDVVLFLISFPLILCLGETSLSARETNKLFCLRITSLSNSSWRPVGCFLAWTSFGEIVTCWALIIMTPRFSSCLGFYYFLLLYFFHYSASSLPPTLLLFFWWPELKLSLAEIMACSCAHHLLIPDSFPLFVLSTQIVAATGKTN